MLAHRSSACKCRLQNTVLSLLLGLLALPAGANAAGWKVATIYNLTGPNGKDALGGLIADAAGNLYGTAAAGGTNDLGVVYKLTPPAPGKAAWGKSTLLKFTNATDAAGNDLGANPKSTLAMDKVGNLYGIATTGGGNSKTNPATTGNGMIFRLTPPAAGQTKWTETGVYYFRDNILPYDADGIYADAAGNLYGTGYLLNADPSKAGTGVIYRLLLPVNPKNPGKIQVIAKFPASQGQAVTIFPHSIIFDAAGNMLGITRASNDGVSSIFKLFAPTTPGGAWTKSTLDVPNAPTDPNKSVSYVVGLAMTPDGKFYGLGAMGAFQEVAFSLAVPAAPGQNSWSMGDIFKMDFGGQWIGLVGLASDAKGNLFSIGTNYDYMDAMIYQLIPPTGGTSWKLTQTSKSLFAPKNYNVAPMVFDTKGNGFGVLPDGGLPYETGAVIQLSPK